jgi:hypothetical protein
MRAGRFRAPAGFDKEKTKGLSCAIFERGRLEKLHGPTCRRPR